MNPRTKQVIPMAAGSSLQEADEASHFPPEVYMQQHRMAGMQYPYGQTNVDSEHKNSSSHYPQHMMSSSDNSATIMSNRHRQAQMGVYGAPSAYPAESAYQRQDWSEAPAQAMYNKYAGTHGSVVISSHHGTMSGQGMAGASTAMHNLHWRHQAASGHTAPQSSSDMMPDEEQHNVGRKARPKIKMAPSSSTSATASSSASRAMGTGSSAKVHRSESQRIVATSPSEYKNYVKREPGSMGMPGESYPRQQLPTVSRGEAGLDQGNYIEAPMSRRHMQ
eukprot:CAMPEP_0184483658 /NCGR_PEP_ID=MMETSP0113_2-20130426/5341_1 /TAXON_ID=91329 /ORGANISM="Norrisiella sphaerica, Strain BC52" /LENGTH=276 /DNA_ID=CAMNT_0026864209 /DNA_START=232 /DNA_END=1062 /DNA_ORIENTATION=+